MEEFSKKGFRTVSGAFGPSTLKNGNTVAKGSDILSKQGSADATSTTANWYSPELTSESWLLPKSRQEILKWPLLGNQKVFCNGTLVSAKDIKVGDTVMSCNGTSQKVLDILRKSPDSKGIKITARFCPPAYLGDYHPVLAIKTNIYGNTKKSRTYREALMYNLIPSKEKLQYVSASLLEKGDFVVIPKIKTIKTPVIDLSLYTDGKYISDENQIHILRGKTNYFMPRMLPITEEFFEMLGWCVAESHINTNGSSVVFTLSKDEKNTALWIMDVLNRNINIPKENMNISDHNGSYRCNINNTVFAEFVRKEFGEGARNKDIPVWLIDSPSNLIVSFLRGWVKGDGTFPKKSNTGTFSVNTVSSQLAHKGYMLFNKVGVLVWFNEKKQDIDYINKYLKNKVKSVAECSYNLGCSGQRVNKIFPELHTNEKNEIRFFEDEQYFYVPISDIETFDTDEDFLCVTTEDHTINVPFVTHNCRIFFNLEPYCQSILMMHSLYPFSKFDLVTPDKSITEFYNDMAFNENFDLYGFILQASLSYCKFGEAICFGNIEAVKEGPWKGKKRWSKFILLEPELVEIKQSSFESNAQYELIPTEEMKALVRSTDAGAAERREKLPKLVVDCIMTGKNIPLDAKSVSTIQRITDPSATRGTPMLQCIFKVLIYQDKIRLAQMAAADRYHFPVELWTLGDVQNGIMPSDADLQNTRDMINQAIQNPPFCLDDKSKILTKNGFRGIDEIAKGDMIATYNKEKDCMEYQPCNDVYEFDYVGEMVHFKTERLDLMVTPDHRCLVQTNHSKTNKQNIWQDKLAKDVAKTNKMKISANWVDGEEIVSVSVCGKEISIDDYLKFVGYFASEGCSVYDTNHPIYCVDVTQMDDSEWYESMNDLFMSLPFNCRKYVYKSKYISKSGKELGNSIITWRFNSKELTKHVRENLYCSDGVFDSTTKFIPTWIKNLKVDKLKVLLDCLMQGDGDIRIGKKAGSRYSTTSKKLAEDVLEIALKCGYAPHIKVEERKGNNKIMYRVYWGKNETSDRTVCLHQPNAIKRVQYEGRVWCISVPNTYFFAERNGRIVITGNSMVFPPIIKYEALGVQGKLLPVSDDYDYIQDQIMVGLGVNKNIITGDGPSFSNLKAISLQKLVMIYKAVRDQFENWMINKFFRPIAIDNGFYYYSGKTKKLILPQIVWYKSLDVEEESAERDAIVKLHADGYVSTKTLFSKFPNLEIDTERKNLEEEFDTVWDKKDDRIPKEFLSGGALPGQGGETGGPTILGPGEEIPENSGGVGSEAPLGVGEVPGTEPGTPAPATEAPVTETPTTPAV